MNKRITIWGRHFDLKVIIDQYKGENILDNQKAALDAFIDSADRILSSYSEVEKYCMEKDADLIGGAITNIFKYVMPIAIFVKRSEKKHMIALLCNYRFDEEHGIALIYENEKLIHIGTQDDI